MQDYNLYKKIRTKTNIAGVKFTDAFVIDILSTLDTSQQDIFCDAKDFRQDEIKLLNFETKDTYLDIDRYGKG